MADVRLMGSNALGYGLAHQQAHPPFGSDLPTATNAQEAYANMNRRAELMAAERRQWRIRAIRQSHIDNPSWKRIVNRHARRMKARLLVASLYVMVAAGAGFAVAFVAAAWRLAVYMVAA